MKIKPLVLLVLFTCYSYGQNASMFDLYKIPKISLHTLDLSGDNLLQLHNTSYSDDGSENNQFFANLNLYHSLFLQSPMSVNKIKTDISFYYNKIKNSYRFSPSELREIIQGSVRIKSYNSWYLNNEKGIFLFADPGLYILDNKNTLNKNESKQSSISTSLGIGYGRITNVRTVVQAYIIADELGCNLSDEKLLKLAEIIERKTSGEYNALYKDDEDIHFYKDLSSITGKPENESKIRQILNSSLYQTSMRETGWQTKLGMRYTYYEQNNFWADILMPYTRNTIVKGTDLFSSFTYSLPVGFNKQFSASAEYSLNLNDDWGRMPKLLLSAFFSIDHNYLWSSKISAFYNTAFLKEGGDLNNYGVSLGSNLVLLNKLSTHATIQYSNNQFSSDSLPDWNPVIASAWMQKDFSISVGLNYRIF